MEHVLPESLGNTTATLQPTVVCDDCNNYFARKVEKPFLESPGIVALRFEENVKNKRGRAPVLERLPTSVGVHGALWRPQQAPRWRVLSLPLPPDELLTAVSGRFGVCVPDRDDTGEPRVVSRFIAKVALESLAGRANGDPVTLGQMIDDPDLDVIRNHARYGRPSVWAVEARRIHSPDHCFDDEGESVQRVWESDFVYTDDGALIFAVSVFGLEWSLDVFDPLSTAYRSWRWAGGYVSLLYPGGVPSDLADAPAAGGGRLVRVARPRAVKPLRRGVPLGSVALMSSVR